jgi:hypothetical protein
MDWCSVYLTPQGLPKYIYLSPPLIFPTTYNGIRTKNRPVWITPGAAPIRWKGPIRNPRWEQKRTEGYVIVSKLFSLPLFRSPKDILKYWSKSRAGKVTHGAFHNDTVNFISSSAPHRYDNVTLIPLVLQLGLRIGPIQRMGAN